MISFFKSKEQKAAEAKAAQEATRLAIEEARKKEQERIRVVKEDYEQKRSDYGYTKRGSRAVTLRGQKFYAFVSDDHFKLFVFPPDYRYYEGKKIPQWQKQSIALKNIQYFAREGQVYTETKISGGGSKGSSVGGAIVGAAIAGPTGAIIASRAPTDPIRSETIKHDSRKTILVYNKGKLDFAPEDFNALMQLIPDKEISVVQQRRSAKKQKNAESQKSNIDVLAELKTMLERGLITQSEYDSKKTEILSRM